MKKFSKKDYIYLTIITIFIILFYFILTHGKYIYGSTTDWKDQHFLFAEYFRNLFYYNHKLIPQFSLNIGAGQNIFNFAYYGLLNPIILISYFLPFLSMMDYIIISSLLIVIISSILIYYWLKENNYNSNICIFSTIIFVCSAPLIFHSHRHIMFMNYMPFLILGLIGIDSYFKNNKFFLITISTCLMIFTSYYYSVCGIIVLGIYFIYKYLEKEQNFAIKKFIFEIIKFCYFIFIAVLISCILLLPILYTILNSRVAGTNSIDFLSLIIPNFDFGYVLYNSYGIGLTGISLLSLFNLFFSKDKQNKFLFITVSLILIIPMFIYLLNGTLYINAKILIPFVPLFILIISKFINNLINKSISLKNLFIITLVYILSCIITNGVNHLLIVLIDLAVSLLCILFYIKFDKKKIFYIIESLILLICVFIVNFNDELYKISDYEVDHNPKLENDIKEILENDDTFYRFNNNLDSLSTSNKIYDMRYYQTSLYSSTYNKNYNNFYTKIFENEIPYRNSIINGSTKNLLFQTFMGEKYIITNKKANLGYEKIKENDDYSIYLNKNYLPIGYASNKILSKKIYDNLEYPYNVEALLNYIIVDDDKYTDYKSNINEYSLEFLKNINIDYKIEDDKYYFELDKKNKINLKLDEPLENKIMFVSFDMELSQSCSDGDTYIIINGVKNKLTCKSWKYHNNNYSFNYVLATDTIDSLDITFSKGKYLIDNIKIYTLDYDDFTKINENINEYNVELNKSENVISGSVNSDDESYFIIKIPYDDGFEIFLDSNKIDYEKVSEGFIGFELNSGNHEIKIVYHTPLLFIGKILSIIGIILFILSSLINKYFDKIIENKFVKKVIGLYKKYEEVINYLIVGGLTTVVSVATYTLCSSILNIYYLIGNIISWVFAVVFAFFANKIYVFKSENKKIWLEVYQFVKYRLLSLAIDMLFMYLLVDIFKLNDIFSKILVQFIVVILNYVFSKLFVFKKDKCD